MTIDLDQPIKTLTGRQNPTGGTVRTWLIFALETHPARNPKAAADQLQLAAEILYAPQHYQPTPDNQTQLLQAIATIKEPIPAGYLYLACTGFPAEPSVRTFLSTTTTTGA